MRRKEDEKEEYEYEKGGRAKKIVKKVVKHLKEDGKDYRKGLRDDKELKGKLREMLVKGRKSKEY